MDKPEDKKTCPECGSQIPVSAKTCPFCRKNLRSWPRRHPILSFLIFSIIVYSIVVSARKEEEPTIRPTNQPLQVQHVQSKDGQYLNYEYSIVSETPKGKYTATFTPFLSPTDTLVTGAMLEMVSTTFGKHQVKNLTPKIISRNGTNLVQFEGVNNSYYFLVIKEDTGKVHSFVFWAE